MGQLAPLKFFGGLNKDDTVLASRPGWVDAQWVRFVTTGAESPVYPQTCGGWIATSATTFTGITRAMHAWVDKESTERLALGSSTGLRSYLSNTFTNITPPQFQGWLRNGNFVTALSTTSGSAQVIVNNNVFDPDANTITLAPHRLQVGDTVTIAGLPTNIGGLNLNGTFTVNDIQSPTRYRFNAGSAASSTASTGLSDYPFVTYNLRAGTASTLWSLDNWGGDLVALREDGPLFQWQAQTYTALDMTTRAAGTGWNLTTGVKTAGTASNYSYSIVGQPEAGRVYRLRMTFTRTAGTLKVGINAGTPTPAIIDISPPMNAGVTAFEFMFQMPADAQDLVFQADSAFAGTLTPNSVTLTPESIAYRIDEAPVEAGFMFVDSHQVLVMGNTYDLDGNRNPLCIRTSDLRNLRSFVPDTNNLAQVEVLAKGGKAIAGIGSRSGNLIFTDTSVFTMAYIGEPGNAFKFNLIGSGYGLIGPKAVVEFAGFAYWMSSNGQFYATTFDFQGVIPKPIPCPIKRDIFDNLASGQNNKIWGYANTQFNEIWWFYVDSRYGGTEINAYCLLNGETGLWSSGRLDATMVRTAGVSAGIFDYPTLAGLVSGTTTKLYDHERGNTADGGMLTSSVTSSEIDIGDGTTMMAVSRVAPDIEGQVGNMSVEIFGKGFQRSSMFSTGAKTITTATDKIDLRFMARSLSFKFSAAATGSFWRLGSVRVEAMKTGVRR